jgi:hypothetical protein
MPRTTETLVSGIIEVDASISLTPFIEIASEIVTDVCAPLGYADTRLEQIERWLSAHLYTVRDPRVTSESAGGVSASYQHSEGLGFNTSSYGQTAMRLDTLGGLASLDNATKTGGRKTVGVTFIGGLS